MDQADLLRHVIQVLSEQSITYMIVGSFASGAYGEPRLTHDIDIVVDLRLDQVAPLCAAFPQPEYYVSMEAARQAVRSGGQFNVIHPTSGNKIDFIMTRQDAWGHAQLSRRQEVRVLPDRTGYTARPEDVILGKLWYYHEGGSEKHLRDITGIMQVTGHGVDQDYIATWAEQLGLQKIWQAVLARLEK